MTNVDPLSQFPIFIQGICNKNPAGTHSLLVICYSIPWGVAHTLHSLPRKELSCLQELPWLSFPGSSLVPPLKINRWRGCLQSQWKSSLWDGKRQYKVPPADKISCPTWNKKLHKDLIYVFSGKFCWKHIWTHRYTALWLWVISESVSESSNRCREFLFPCKGCHQ